MYKLSFLVLLIINSFVFSQSPHGEITGFDCEDCHSTDSWKINLTEFKFDHSQTNFELIGQHRILDCQSCHQNLKFSKTQSKCFECHTDIHQNTVTQDCQQCHTNNSWLVSNINNIHRMSRFPLLGAHKFADCQDCHSSANSLMFETLGVECIDCHLIDYQSTNSPDHVAVGFSKDCQECHQVSDLRWSGASTTHNFFPLTGGHDIGNCFDCHSQNTFEGLIQDCYACHQANYNSTSNPNHITASFSTDCLQCHTTNPGWKPASFKAHDNFFPLLGAHKLIENDCAKCHTNGYENTPNQCYDCHRSNYERTSNPVHQSIGFGTDCESCHNSNAWQPATFEHDNQFFPIYSGEHKNEWNECSDCHTNPSNYQVFECINCHEHNQSEMDDEHKEVNGYVYESNACLSCHPNGDSDDNFNHSLTEFPLTGAHVGTDCAQCHSTGYQGISTECSSCHLSNFQNSINPNHEQLNLETNCKTCHTTNPSWQPALFPIHNDFYLIQGTHLNLANDCSSCHAGDYNNTPNTCYGCHQNDYSSTTDPAHATSGFGTDCEDCHTQTVWTPSTFDHDGLYFPIYSGAHKEPWNSCSDCHVNQNDFSQFSCLTCHEHNQTDMDNKHKEEPGYSYNSNACYDCHPNGKSDGAALRSFDYKIRPIK